MQQLVPLALVVLAQLLLINNGIVNSSGIGTITSTSVFNNLTWNMSGTGTVTTFTNAANGVLNISSATVPAFTTFTAIANPNTVNYSGAVQTIIPTSYYNLTINQSGGTATLGGSSALTTVNGNLDINTGSLTIPSTNFLTVNGNTTLNSAQCLIILSDGSHRLFIDNGISGTGTAEVESSLSETPSRW